MDVSSGPSAAQKKAAESLKIELSPDTPEPVAAAIIRRALRSEMWLAEPASLSDAGYESLSDLADRAGISIPATLGDSDELDAWFKAAFARLSARHLRRLKPEVGDIVAKFSQTGELVEISSIGNNGVVYFKGVGQRAHPDHLFMKARNGSRDYRSARAKATNARRHADTRSIMAGASVLSEIAEFKVLREVGLDAENALLAALREAVDERPLQKVIEQYPELLARIVDRNHDAYVIPQKRLGKDYIPDFLVAGITSYGLQWTLVEIESPTRPLTIGSGEAAEMVRHAMKQIKDWRRWLESNLDEARRSKREHGLGLPGITTHARGLVIIGRGSPSFEIEHMRAEAEREQRITIRTYDWLVRTAHTPSKLKEGALDGEWTTLSQSEPF